MNCHKRKKITITEKKLYLSKVRPRYLPGSVAPSVWLDDMKMYKRHRLNCYCATAIVNSCPPWMNPHSYIKTRRMSEDIARAIHIDKENKNLLKKINLINRSKGYVDTFNERAYLSATRWPAHKKKMQIIEIENKDMYNRLVKTKPVYSTSRFKEEWKIDIEEMMHMARFTLQLFLTKSVDRLVREMPSISGGLDKLSKRPLCYIDFRVKDGVPLGRIIIELYSDCAPNTVENFLSLCKGTHGYSYKSCKIYNILKGQYMETGDVIFNNGKGGMSIYGEVFQEEKNSLKHTKPGVLSMIRIGRRYNNSQFSITLSAQEHLDGKRVVFGKTIKGIKTLYDIQQLGKKIGSPIVPIYIENCGQIRNRKENRGKRKDLVNTLTSCVSLPRWRTS